MDNDEFPLLVAGCVFTCFYQQGEFVDDRWRKSDGGSVHVAVCKCGRGVYGTSIDDAVAKLTKSYSVIRAEEHWHMQDTPLFNIIIGTDGTWVMGTITDPELLGDL